MLLADYISIDDGVVVVGQLTKEEIIQNVIGVDNDDWSEGDDCDQLPLPPNRTVKEVAEALSVLEDFCEQIPHGACATEHLTAIRAIVAAQVRPKKQIRLQTSVTNKGTMPGRILHFCCSFDISTIG